MIPIKPALSYFRDCYRLDTRTTQLDNFFGRKVEQRYLFEGKEQLLNGKMPYLPIPDELGEKLDGVLSLYSQEKGLYYASFFVVGFGTTINGRQQRICAPLFLNEVQLARYEDGYSISIDPGKRLINLEPLSGIRKTEEDIRSLISHEVPADGFGFGSLRKLRSILERSYENLSAEDLLLYPTLNVEKTIKRLYSRKHIKEGCFQVVPAAGLCLIKRSSDTQGIMTELAAMANEHMELPDSVKALFGQQVYAPLFKTRTGHVPGVLNEAQKSIIKNAHKYSLSMAIGPPGTGKSFTIASLAIEYMSRGKSVLIVSKTDQAVDVIESKIEHDLGIKKATVRAGKRDYLKKLKARMTEILGGFRTKAARDAMRIDGQVADAMEVGIHATNNLIKKCKKEYDSLIRHENRWGERLAKSNPESFFDALRLKYIHWLTDQKKPHWLVADEYMQALAKNTRLIREYIELLFELRITDSLLKDRKTVRKLLNAIRARTSGKRELLFSELNFGTMFNAFPIWLCKLSDLHKVLPFQPELFDVVIIDEATQCDVASCLPAIYRANRTVIVGDPKQLRHVSFLSGTAQHVLQKKYGLEDTDGSLDYRNNSILDFVDNALKSQEQVTFLNEHYRSLPDLIRFSNKHFYGDGLRIMNVIPEDHSRNNIEHIIVEGSRNTQGFNEHEANRILADIQMLIREEKDLDAHLSRSLGILSPFRDQVDRINTMILENLSLDAIHKHDILCGTAHSFQGEERDIMFLSFALDNSSHATGFNHLNRPDVFNVSVTRAKSTMKVYTSFDLTKLKADAYLRLFLAEAASEPRKGAVLNDVYDVFLDQVIKAMAPHDLRLKVGYEVADLSLDLAVIRGEKIVAVDLIGYPGVFKEGLALSTYKVLHRAGIRTFPMPYSFWKLDQEHCEKALLDFINEEA